jgi:hypothetical protein
MLSMFNTRLSSESEEHAEKTRASPSEKIVCKVFFK